MKHRWNYSIEKEEVHEIHNNKIHHYFTVQEEILTFTLNLYSKEICFKLTQDIIPISCINVNYFFLHQEFAHSNPSPINPQSFQQHITDLPKRKQSLIKNYKDNKINSSLAAAIQMNQPLIIVSDGSKSKIVSGSAWIIADMTGKTLTVGINPDFGNIKQIHSHPAELYGVLSVFIFLQEYSNHFMIPAQSNINYYCDNIEVVHKINMIFNNRNYFDERHKTTNHEVVLQLRKSLPTNVIAFHVKGHQDKQKKWENLTIPARLNIQADELIGNNATVSINNHITNTSLALYINGKYIPNNYITTVRSSCGEKQVKSFLMKKHRWIKSIIDDIDWNFCANFIKKQTYSRKKTLTKFVHRWLTFGNKNFGQKLMCPHCRQQESILMDHDHFLICSSSGRRKQLRLRLLTNLLQHLKTPPKLSQLIVYGLQSFYNSQINNIHASDYNAINNQRKIGCNNFSRSRISKQFTMTMNKYFKENQLTSTFTGIGWTKQLIQFTVSTHINKWYHRYDSNSTPNQISFQKTLMSLEKRSLIIIIQFSTQNLRFCQLARKFGLIPQSRNIPNIQSNV